MDRVDASEDERIIIIFYRINSDTVRGRYSVAFSQEILHVIPFFMLWMYPGEGRKWMRFSSISLPVHTPVLAILSLFSGQDVSCIYSHIFAFIAVH